MDRALFEAPTVTPEAIHHVGILEDDTAVTLYQAGGEHDRIEAVFEGQSSVLSYDITRTRDGFYVYARSEPTEAVAELLAIPRESGVILDTPLEYTGGGVRVTVMGESEAISEAMSKLPAEIELDVEQFGEYEPETERLFSLLTGTQQEVLELAVVMGYFDSPRRATCADIARELDCAPKTISEHLHKGQATVLTEIVP